jgi:hypothetical protein
MRLLNILIIFLIIITESSAQEVILLRKDIPKIGTKIYMNYNKIDSPLVLSNFSTTGTDNFWDFSLYNLRNTDTITFDSIPQSDSLFSKATLVQISFWNTDKIYINYNDTQFLYCAYKKSYFDLFGGPLYPVINPFLYRFKFPMQFSDSISKKANVQSYGIAHFDSAYNLVDSQFLIETISYSSNLKAKGKVKLKSGLYNSIMDYTYQTLIDSLYIKNSSTNWEWKFYYVVGFGFADKYSWFVNGCIVPAVEYFPSTNLLGIRDNELPVGLNTSYNSINPILYPNPTSSLLHIDIKNLNRYKYRLYDFAGRMIKEGIIDDGILNINELRSGSYLIYLFNDTEFSISNHIIVKVD